jgi:hypothetical protein
MTDNSDGLDLLPWADRRPKRPAPPAAPAETTADPPTEPTPQKAGPPIDAVLALILLRHLGVKVVEHRDGTFTGSFKDCDIVWPLARDGKIEKKTPLELLRHCWFFDSRREVADDDTDDVSEEYSEKDEAEFRTWFWEQVAVMDERRRAPPEQPQPEADEAPPPAGQQVARPLTDLVRLIKKQLRLGEEAAAPHWLEVGKLLHEAKAQLAHGSFGDWCKEHFGISATQRARYMKAAESAVQNFRAGKYEASSLEEHLRGTSYQTGGKAQDWTPHVDAIADRTRRELDRIREAETTRQQERDLRRKLLLKLIDRGYKSLAAELHPDKGGSTEAMTRLNEVRDAVKRCTTGIGVL